MTPWRLAVRGLWFHRRSWWVLGAGVAVATAVLVAALLVGDAVRAGLAGLTAQRLGGVQVALVPPGRFFRDALAADLGGAPALQLRAVASRPDGRAAAPDVTLLGVDGRFFETWGAAPPALADEARVWLGERLARDLEVSAGDRLVLRLPRPSAMPGDAPMALDSSKLVALSVEVAGVLPADRAGSFTLVPHGPAPLVAYVSLPWLQGAVDLEGRANLVVAASASAADLQARLREVWQLADAGLSLDRAAGRLESDRVLLEPSVDAALDAAGVPTTRVLSWFVRSARRGDRSSPYAFVAAVDPPPTPELPPGHVVLNQWLADDLTASVGDTVTLDYWAFGPRRALEPRSSDFTVHAVLPMTGPGADPTLTPAYPGFEEARTCREWDPAVPVDLEVIRDADEAYWKAHRGAPKAFVRLHEGRTLWTNPWGTLTSAQVDPGRAGDLDAGMRRHLDPASVGLQVFDVAARAAETGRPSTDFAGLFAGFGFVLQVSALLLAALLFGLAAAAREAELATLAALGLRRRAVRGVLLREGSLVAVLGAVVGAAAGVPAAAAVLAGLDTVWRDAVAGLPLALVVTPGPLVGGALGGALTAVGAMALAARWRRSVRTAGAEWRLVDVPSLAWRNLARHRGRSAATVALLAVGTMLVTAVGSYRHDAAAQAGKRASGTGGFPLYAELSAPLLQDLDTDAGLEAFGLERADVGGARFVPLRARAGDDASCLNLGQALEPRLLGVRPADLAERGAFAGAEVWEALAAEAAGDVIPAVGDEATVVWGLFLGLGDTLTTRAEDGRMLTLRVEAILPTSALQGALLVDERHFARHWPSESGDRMLLVDVPEGEDPAALAATLTDALGDLGVVVAPTWQRLGRFLEVENTYLAIFGALGALGLVLGVLGVAVLLARSVVERRPELALLAALGWRRRDVRRLLLVEHAVLVVGGVVLGAVPAVAVLGVLTSAPLTDVALVAAATLLVGLAATTLTARWALRGQLSRALDAE